MVKERFRISDDVIKYPEDPLRSQNIIFAIIFVTILASGVLRKLLGHDIVTLTSFFQLLSEAPSIPTDWISILHTNFGETFVFGFQWLGSTIDFFVDIFSATMFAGTATLNALLFLIYFIRWLFL